MSFGIGALRRPIVFAFLCLSTALTANHSAAAQDAPAPSPQAEQSPPAPPQVAAPEAQPANTAPSEDAEEKAAERERAAAKPVPGAEKIKIVLIREQHDRAPPLSLLDIPPPDDGMAGARLAIQDNNTTGRFMKQEFVLDVVESANHEELIAEAVKHADAGEGFFVLDVPPKLVLAISDALKDKDAVIFNAGAPDDDLREENCRINVKHTAPARSMLADGLAQYMAWKRWAKWLLVVGPQPEDKAFADALRRSAKRFGLRIVEERNFTYDPGGRRTDGGFEQVQQQIPSFTQKAPEHDVQVVADEGGLFGEYFPYRTWDPKPVIGTAGLYPASWHPAMEQWGATQFQNRFKRLAKRTMRPLDYNVWTAVRAVGEAATRKKSSNVKDLIAYMRAPEFEIAAFKGQKLTFRAWNGQLRQPILIATAKLPVTVSPQPGFLHQLTELDTLGIDKPESKCKAFGP
jgi:ABC transporter substrate binding protein (PQQ-dependent alcohol dehydrogenase system)